MSNNSHIATFKFSFTNMVKSIFAKDRFALAPTEKVGVDGLKKGERVRLSRVERFAHCLPSEVLTVAIPSHNGHVVFWAEDSKGNRVFTEFNGRDFPVSVSRDVSGSKIFSVLV